MTALTHELTLKLTSKEVETIMVALSGYVKKSQTPIFPWQEDPFYKLYLAFSHATGWGREEIEELQTALQRWNNSPVKK